ncbi:alpha/beta hydrolase [Pendulispora rubella]|uniref:Alpha/beta hydrolase n=1 Tax=Pendulispora rubella TaxID=2741070 RepID=A0ABZ2LFF5_9BACT
MATCLFAWALSLVGCGSPAEDPSQREGVDGTERGEGPLSTVEQDDEKNPQAEPANATADLDEVRTVHHYVPVGWHRTVHVVQKFTKRCTRLRDRRSVLLLPGTIVKADFYDIDVDGYRFQTELAKAGYNTFATDYEGSGGSSYPDDGHDVTHRFLVEESRRVLEAVRHLGGVPRVDVLGESNGGAVASELCDDARRARSCVLSSMIYRTGTPMFYSVFLDPSFLAFIDGQPQGYMNTTSDLYFNIVPRSPKPVQDAILATQPGKYAVGTMLAPAKGLPWFDPTRARVPALILQGTLDNTAEQSDADDLRASYGSRGGGVATLVRVEGANHIPRIENPPYSVPWKNYVFEFLKAH